VSKYPCRLVELTGGEPLLQEHTPQLIQELLSRGYTVLLETNGSIACDGLDIRCIKIVDVKCPSSGEAHSFNTTVLDGLHELDELKFVIADRDDYEFARDFIRIHADRIPGTVHFSPVVEKLPVAELAAWIMTDGLSVRLAPQLHRFIWPEAERGV
jgi:7-carboxy-7-deazaguanine synthase